MTEQMPLEEAAQYLNVSERTLRRRIQSGKITANKIKGKWIVDINLDDNTEKTATRQQDADLSGQNGTNADLAELVSQLKSENEHLRGTNQQLLSSMDEARTRSDTIIMQLSQQIDRQQLQLEDIRRNRSIFARIRDVFIPSSTSTPRLSDHFRCVNRWLMVALFFYIRDTTESETDASKIA